MIIYLCKNKQFFKFTLVISKGEKAKSVWKEKGIK